MAGMDALARYQIDLLKNRVAELERWREQLAAADQCASELRNGASPYTGGISPAAEIKPTLTNAEREAVLDAALAYEGDPDEWECEKIARTLRGLLKRLG